MAQELYSLDIVFQKSEELVQVLGVQPAVLIEILTCASFLHASLYHDIWCEALQHDILVAQHLLIPEQACRREPGLLVVTPSQLGMRVMALKMSLPLLNVPELIRRHPKVLRSEVCATTPMPLLGTKFYCVGSIPSSGPPTLALVYPRAYIIKKCCFAVLWQLATLSWKCLVASYDHPGVSLQNGVSAVKRAVKDMNMLMPAYHVQVLSLALSYTQA